MRPRIGLLPSRHDRALTRPSIPFGKLLAKNDGPAGQSPRVTIWVSSAHSDAENRRLYSPHNMRRSPYYGQKPIAAAANDGHIRRMRCGYYGDIYPWTAGLAKIPLGQQSLGGAARGRSPPPGAVDRTHGGARLSAAQRGDPPEPDRGGGQVQ